MLTVEVADTRAPEQGATVDQPGAPMVELRLEVMVAPGAPEATVALVAEATALEALVERSGAPEQVATEPGAPPRDSGAPPRGVLVDTLTQDQEVTKEISYQKKNLFKLAYMLTTLNVVVVNVKMLHIMNLYNFLYHTAFLTL